RRAARVVNSERTERVDLYRFDRSGNEVPRHPKVLADLVRVSKRYLALIGKKARILSKKAASFTVDSPLASGDIWPSHAVFNAYDLDLPTTRLMLEIARMGDMSIIVSDRQVVFTDQGQVARVPEGWIKNGEAPVVCRAP